MCLLPKHVSILFFLCISYIWERICILDNILKDEFLKGYLCAILAYMMTQPSRSCFDNRTFPSLSLVQTESAPFQILKKMKIKKKSFLKSIKKIVLSVQYPSTFCHTIKNIRENSKWSPNKYISVNNSYVSSLCITQEKNQSNNTVVQKILPH